MEVSTWKVGSSEYSACPEYGALLMQWDIKIAGKSRSVIYWPGKGFIRRMI